MSDTYLKPTLNIFTRNRVINSHAFSLDSQHGTATTISIIVITQAGNSPFNHDLYHTEGFVFSPAKSKEKTESLKIISQSRNYKGNGCKLSVQRFLGSFGWLPWFQLTLVHPNNPRNPCTQSLYPFSLEILKPEIKKAILLTETAIRL